MKSKATLSKYKANTVTDKSKQITFEKTDDV